MSNTIQKNPAVAQQLAKDQADLQKLETELTSDKSELQQVKSAQSQADARIEALEKSDPKNKAKYQTERKALDAAFKTKVQTLQKKVGEESTQASGLQAKVQALLKQESDAASRGFNWAPEINQIAQGDGKALSADEKKLADEKKSLGQAEKDIDARIDAMEKADPSAKPQLEDLRTRLKAELASKEQPLADKVATDKANVKELQGEVDARASYFKNKIADEKKGITSKFAAEEKADAGKPKKLAADKKAEQSALADLKKHQTWLDDRGAKAQKAVNLAKNGKDVPDFFAKDKTGKKTKPSDPKGGGKKTTGGHKASGKGGKTTGGKTGGAKSYGEPWKKGAGQLEGGDTSHYQSNSTFQSSIAGKQFAAIKATEGTGYTDPDFKARWNELGDKIKQGKMKLRMAYCFLDTGNGAGQAKHFLDALGIHGKLQPGTRLALDWEGSALSSPQTLKDAANYIHKVTGLWPVVYTSASQAGRAKAAVPNAPLWEAQWTGGKANHNVPFVQYSDGPGYDHDVFNGGEKALEKFAGWE